MHIAVFYLTCYKTLSLGVLMKHRQHTHIIAAWTRISYFIDVFELILNPYNFWCGGHASLNRNGLGRRIPNCLVREFGTLNVFKYFISAYSSVGFFIYTPSLKKVIINPTLHGRLSMAWSYWNKNILLLKDLTFTRGVWFCCHAWVFKIDWEF